MGRAQGLLKACYCRFMEPGAVRRKAAENDLADRRRLGERIGDRSDRNFRRAFSRETIDPGRDRRKSDCREPMFFAKLERTAIAGRKQIVLAKLTAIPHRSHRVDHMGGLETVASGDLGIAGLATVQHSAFRDEFWTGRAMDGAIDP